MQIACSVFRRACVCGQGGAINKKEASFLLTPWSVALKRETGAGPKRDQK